MQQMQESEILEIRRGKSTLKGVSISFGLFGSASTAGYVQGELGHGYNIEVMGITIFNNILRLFFMLATVTTSKTTSSSSGGSMSTPSVSPCRQLGQDLHKVTFSLDSCKCCKR